MNNQKKLNLIPLLVAFIIIGVVIYFIKPNKLITYARAKLGVKNTILIYELNKDSDTYQFNKSELGNFLINRGIPGTAYEDGSNEYYVTIVPADTNPKTELEFGFKEISGEEFYKTVYNARQVYFTKTLRAIEQ